tara:strand:+ start:795 stop:986 length:192 start_codon:yes stop_codon:yes gene_type:complete
MQILEQPVGTVLKVLSPVGPFKQGEEVVFRGVKKDYEDVAQVSLTNDSRKYFYAPHELELANV